MFCNSHNVLQQWACGSITRTGGIRFEADQKHLMEKFWFYLAGEHDHFGCVSGTLTNLGHEPIDGTNQIDVAVVFNC